jgi:ABC-type tungstate transport system permease subunit
MEETKRVRKITEWNTIGMRPRGRPKKIRGKGEGLNDLQKLKAKSWTYLVKDSNAWYEDQKSYTVVVSAEEEEKVTRVYVLFCDRGTREKDWCRTNQFQTTLTMVFLGDVASG